MRHFIYQLVLLLVIFYSVFGVYQQLSLILNAQQEIKQLQSKNLQLSHRNTELKRLLSP